MHINSLGFNKKANYLETNDAPLSLSPPVQFFVFAREENKKK